MSGLSLGFRGKKMGGGGQTDHLQYVKEVILEGNKCPPQPIELIWPFKKYICF